MNADRGIQLWAWVLAGAFLLLALLVSLAGFRSGVQFSPPDGISAFAVFYLAAAGVERILEPFSGILVGAQKTNEAMPTKKANLDATDKAKAETNGTLVMWGAATFVASLACWYFGLSLFKAVGVTGSVGDPAALFVTALIIGAGTKPLHDLISNLETSKGS